MGELLMLMVAVAVSVGFVAASNPLFDRRPDLLGPSRRSDSYPPPLH